ncbi:HlyD family secretion protein [Francisella sp. XLW-1]|uniref:HlyD family secretion protein n=1 Tax=Francisella sp. XLW-1 TaxID=2610887 RepID=UPI00123DBB8B|nr:HlyD family secretion protein [Francisella sp. XLW-1]
MDKIKKIILGLVIIIVALFSLYYVWIYYIYSPWTRDGRVRAKIVTISPDVSGFIVKLNVKDNQIVKKGDLILEIDPSRYKAQLDGAKARVAQAEIALHQAQDQFDRRKNLVINKGISREDYSNAKMNVDLKKASFDEAKSSEEIAQINYNRTKIYAPADGYITNTTLTEGNYVTTSAPILSLIETNSFYITGYFEETKIPRIKVGNKVRITLMSGTELSGVVESIGRGVADRNTDTNRQALPAVQPTYNWVRLSARIPVNIKLTSVPVDTVLSSGMNATVTVE